METIYRAEDGDHTAKRLVVLNSENNKGSLLAIQTLRPKVDGGEYVSEVGYFPLPTTLAERTDLLRNLSAVLEVNN